jgi:putative Ca2+/H+ antiporter (TMEM165/GDT1 family)
MGDRSQISAVALAAKYTYFSLAVGGSIGHMLATGLASVCGKVIGKYCSEKCINYAGGIIFLGFSIYSLVVDIILADG